MGVKDLMDSMDTGVVSEAAAQVTQPNAEGAAPAAQEQLVPVSALQAERRERQQAQESLKLMQDHVQLLQANQAKAASEPADTLRDDDVLTVGEAKRSLAQEKQQTQSELLELKMQQAFPDYGDVVRQFLPHVLKEDPELREEIQRAINPYRMAYKLAKRSDAYQKAQKEKMSSPEAAKAIANAQRPGNLSSVGSVSPSSGVSNWKHMSDAEFMKAVN